MKIKLDYRFADEEEPFDPTGWTSMGGTYKSDSDSYRHGAQAVVEAIEKGFTVLLFVEDKEDNDTVDFYGRK